MSINKTSKRYICRECNTYINKDDPDLLRCYTCKEKLADCPCPERHPLESEKTRDSIPCPKCGKTLTLNLDSLDYFCNDCSYGIKDSTIDAFEELTADYAKHNCPKCKKKLNYDLTYKGYYCDDCGIFADTKCYRCGEPFTLNPEKNGAYCITCNVDWVTKGVKHDKGKNMLQLIPDEMIEGIGEILTFGATKYEKHNWRKGLPYDKVYGAMKRHLSKWHKGIVNDEETGKPHLWHAGCCLAFLITYEAHPETYKEFDDRFIYGETNA